MAGDWEAASCLNIILLSWLSQYITEDALLFHEYK